MLQKQRDEDGGETLSELDKLYVVHVVQHKGKERWDAGGPILPRLSTALEKYPHTTAELEVAFLASEPCLPSHGGAELSSKYFGHDTILLQPQPLRASS